MKRFKLVSLFMLVAFLAGCQTNGSSESKEATFNDNESSRQELILDDTGITTDLEAIPYLTRSENVILLVDLVTGQTLTEYVLQDEYAWVGEVFDFDNGYYAALVGISSQQHLVHMGLIDPDEVDWDREDQAEHDYQVQFLIFDQDLNRLDSLPIDDRDQEFFVDLYWVDVSVTFDGSELFLYFSPSRVRANPDNPMEVIFDDYSTLQTYHVTTGELRTLVSELELDVRQTFRISPEYLFYFNVEGLGGGGGDASNIRSIYGVINLETGVIDSFEREGIWEIIQYETSSHVLMARRGEVLVFDFTTMQTEMVHLREDDFSSYQSQLSLNRNHLVTLSDDHVYFRKYDITSSDLIKEIAINPIDYDPSDHTAWMIGGNALTPIIFPITDSVYAIHLFDRFGYQGMHQLIDLR
ncbi:MAG: hypothetical protein FWE07_01500 [Turicibacter sp.]|nr:hypothetical protein [Turicibacter sp.]